MTYKKANEIEQILDEMYHAIWGMKNWYIYGGVARGGQPRLWQHRFRQLTNGAVYSHIEFIGNNYYPRVAASFWTFDTSSASAQQDDGARFTYTDNRGTFIAENIGKASTNTTAVDKIFVNSTVYGQGYEKQFGVKITTPLEICPDSIRFVSRYRDHLTIIGHRKNGTSKVLYDENLSYIATFSTTRIEYGESFDVDNPPQNEFYESIEFIAKNTNESYTTTPAIRYIYMDSCWTREYEQENP